MITEQNKKEIVAAIKKDRVVFGGSDTKHAKKLGISPSQYSRVMRGETERILSDANWMSIARRLGVELVSEMKWNVAETPVYRYITAQLEKCQEESLSALLCDCSDIGKTFTARTYCRLHTNAVYVDCSQAKTKTALIRYIAKEYGVGHTGRYADVYEDLVFYLKTLPTPLIILDEAGDLQYEAFLEIKALWNATEGFVGYYMMGADGLREKITRSISAMKVGYTEIFSRFGKRYLKAIPANKEERDRMMYETAVMIIRANCNADADTVYRRTMGADGMPSLRRINKEIRKLNTLKRA